MLARFFHARGHISEFFHRWDLVADSRQIFKGVRQPPSLPARVANSSFASLGVFSQHSESRASWLSPLSSRASQCACQQAVKDGRKSLLVPFSIGTPTA